MRFSRIGFLWSLFLGTLVSFSAYAEFQPSGQLEIHYINVGQGASTLIIGPDGTTILYDFGGKASAQDILDYMQNRIGLAPSDGIDYAILSHRHDDHYKGYKQILKAGYDIKTANYDSGSLRESRNIFTYWLEPADTTSAGAVQSIPVGLSISLGDGATATVVAANGKVYRKRKRVEVEDENDSSVALFISYKNFQYILDGDLGDGPESCTNHQTSQQKIQSEVGKSLIKYNLIDEKNGVDVLHIAHHGSESSTSAQYYNLMKPEVGLISVGKKNAKYCHPRVEVVNSVLLEGSRRTKCVKAPPLKALFQTEDGDRATCKTGRTSFTGWQVGDIKLATDGEEKYIITSTGRVHGGSALMKCLPENPCVFQVDEL